MAAAGHPADESLIIDCDSQEKENLAIIRKAITEQKRDGLFSSIEKLGIACYQAANDLQLAIPGQIKIVSFSNLETVALLNPSLTTITQPAFEIGR